MFDYLCHSWDDYTGGIDYYHFKEVQMFGKAKCKILKSIRVKIAEENNIPYEPKKCTFESDCPGTCPQCEAEVRYLEEQLMMKHVMEGEIHVNGLITKKAQDQWQEELDPAKKEKIQDTKVKTAEIPLLRGLKKRWPF